jgi:hypothetical protein
MKTYTFHISVPDMPDTWRRVELAGEQTLRDLHVAIQEALDWDPDDDMAFFVGENPLEDGEQYTLDFDDDWDEDDQDDEEIASMVEALPPLDLGDAPRPESMEEALALIESNPEVRAQVRKMLVDEAGMPGFMVDMLLGNMKSLFNMMPAGMLAGLTGGGPEAKNAAETSLESLALVEGQKMLYMVGDDEWRFDVRLDAIDDNADDDALYPLVLAGEGPAPEQTSEEDDEDDDPFAWMWEDEEEDEDDSEDED